MCGNKGFGGLFGGGGLGGILGGLAGGALDFIAPEIGVPLALATGAGSALGSTIGGVASGEPFGQALTGGLEAGALSGALTGLGSLATTGDFLAAPGAALEGPLGGLLGGAGTAGAAGDTLGAAPLTPVDVTPLAAPGAAGVGSASAPAAGATGALPAGGLPAAVGSDQGSFMGALSSETPGTLTQNLGTAAPAATEPGFPSADFSSASPEGGIGSRIVDYIAKNPGLLLAGGGLATSIMRGNQVPGLDALKTQAAQLSIPGNQNLQAMVTGQLPAGAQSSLDAGAEAAKAQIRSQFASMGATGSTSEAEALAGVDMRKDAQKVDFMRQISQLGLQEVGAANDLYNTIMRTEIASDQATQDAIARLAAALAGSNIQPRAAAA